MDSLRVPKRPADVDILHADGSSSRARLFLAECAGNHDGPETLGDLLSASDFLPAVDVDGGPMSWLAVGGIAMVTAARALGQGDDAADLLLPEEHELELVLSNGQAIRGLASYVRPPQAARLTDFLNDRRPFLRLLVGEEVAYVNKRHVLKVVAHDGE